MRLREKLKREREREICLSVRLDSLSMVEIVLESSLRTYDDEFADAAGEDFRGHQTTRWRLLAYTYEY